MTDSIADNVENIAYEENGKISFRYLGKKFIIREPRDVLLVGGGYPAQRWIAQNFGFLLQVIDKD